MTAAMTGCEETRTKLFFHIQDRSLWIYKKDIFEQMKEGIEARVKNGAGNDFSGRIELHRMMGEMITSCWYYIYVPKRKSLDLEAYDIFANKFFDRMQLKDPNCYARFDENKWQNGFLEHFVYCVSMDVKHEIIDLYYEKTGKKKKKKKKTPQDVDGSGYKVSYDDVYKASQEESKKEDTEQEKEEVEFVTVPLERVIAKGDGIGTENIAEKMALLRSGVLDILSHWAEIKKRIQQDEDVQAGGIQDNNRRKYQVAFLTSCFVGAIRNEVEICESIRKHGRQCYRSMDHGLLRLTYKDYPVNYDSISENSLKCNGDLFPGEGTEAFQMEELITPFTQKVLRLHLGTTAISSQWDRFETELYNLFRGYAHL